MLASTLVHRSASDCIALRRRRGVALLLVLSVIAVASVLSWAMLSSAALRARLNDNLQSSVSGRYLADSGVSYAMYYLRYPEKSPVALTTGAYNTFYGGQSGLTLWDQADGVVNVVVTNTAKDTFLIRSTALVDGLTQVSEAEVSITTTGYRVDSAAAFGGAIQLPSTVSITGLVSTVSTVANAAGNILSSLGGSTISVKADAVPAFNTLELVKETGVTASTGGTDRTYTIDGVTYIAEKAPLTISGTLNTSRPTLNPANVWYSDDSVTINGATIVGTLILRNDSKDLTVQGTNTINAKASALPALVVGKELKLSHTSLKAARLNVNGVTYLNNKISASGSTLLAMGNTFQGALLMGASAPKIEGTTGPITITKTATAADVRLTKDDKVSGITVNRWTRLN